MNIQSIFIQGFQQIPLLGKMYLVNTLSYFGDLPSHWGPVQSGEKLALIDVQVPK